MEAKERMTLLLKDLRMSALDLAKGLGYSRAIVITNVMTGRNGISRALATKIVTKWPQYNYEWLRSGAGDMRSKSLATPTTVKVSINRITSDMITDVLGITEYELGKRIGVSPSALVTPSYETLVKVAHTFPGLNPEWLIGMSNEPLRQECSRCAELESLTRNLLDLIDMYKEKLAQAKQAGGANKKTGTAQ